MSLLVNSGRVAIAAALKERTFHVAWGAGPSWWDAVQIITATFAGAPQQIALPHAPVTSVTVKSEDGETTYASPADYTWNMASGVITRNITGDIPSLATVEITAQYGRPAASSDMSALTEEVGRRRANTVAFVTPDDEGEIVLADGSRWSISEEPTRYLLVRTIFDYADAADETIREVAIFVGTVAEDGVPNGQAYLTPEEVADPGHMLLFDRPSPLLRSVGRQDGYSYVLTP
jgi:hypothetical protein